MCLSPPEDGGIGKLTATVPICDVPYRVLCFGPTEGAPGPSLAVPLDVSDQVLVSHEPVAHCTQAKLLKVLPPHPAPGFVTQIGGRRVRHA